MSTRELPWHKHKLGIRPSSSFTAEEAIRTAGLDWTIVKKELYVGSEHRLMPGMYASVREDLWNEDSGGLLGATPAGYTPLQNTEAFSFLDPIVKTGVAVYDSAGSLLHGEWVWVILRFHGDREIVARDPMAQFLLFGHSPRNGQHRLTYLPVRLICQNTLSGGTFHNPAPLVTLPKIRPRRFQVSDEAAIAEILQHFSDMTDQFKRMAHTRVSEQEIQQYLTAVFQDWIKKNHLYGGARSVPQSLSDYAADVEQCKRLFREGCGNSMPEAAGTLWAACSAVAEYVDFDRLDPNDPKYLNEVWFSELKGSALKIARKSTGSAFRS